MSGFNASQHSQARGAAEEDAPVDGEVRAETGSSARDPCARLSSQSRSRGQFESLREACNSGRIERALDRVSQRRETGEPSQRRAFAARAPRSRLRRLCGPRSGEGRSFDTSFAAALGMHHGDGSLERTSGRAQVPLCRSSRAHELDGDDVLLQILLDGSVCTRVPTAAMTPGQGMGTCDCGLANAD